MWSDWSLWIGVECDPSLSLFVTDLAWWTIFTLCWFQHETYTTCLFDKNYEAQTKIGRQHGKNFRQRWRTQIPCWVNSWWTKALRFILALWNPFICKGISFCDVRIVLVRSSIYRTSFQAEISNQTQQTSLKKGLKVKMFDHFFVLLNKHLHVYTPPIVN